MKKTSLADIAGSLKVSKTLVSMVLNGKGDAMGISKDTQKKVLAKAKELNYRPNHFARGLRMGSSQSIGLIVSDVSNPFYAKICKVVENEISSKGYNLIICSTDENVEREKEIIDMMMSKQVDGIILSSSDHTGETIRSIINRNCPVVLIDRYIDGVDAPFVGVENHKSAFEVTQQLLQKDYKNVAFFNISPADVSSVKDRFEGFKKAMNGHLNGAANLISFNIDFKNVQKQVEKALEKCFQSNPKVDALFTVNNNVAIAVMMALKSMNKKPGNELALVSFDDIELFRLSSPTISAIEQPIEEIARVAAKKMISLIKEPKTKVESQLLPTKIIFRESVRA